MLEVVGIKGVVHMGQIQGGLSGAIRLAQGGRVFTDFFKPNSEGLEIFKLIFF